MGRCTNHPDRETSYLCLKNGRYLCEECLACGDPRIYCKFRSSCIIWFMTTKNTEPACNPASEPASILKKTTKHQNDKR